MMILNFDNLSVTIKANLPTIDLMLIDEKLFSAVKLEIIGLLSNPFTQIIDFGFSPDHDADSIEELLLNGVFFRIIGQDRFLGIDLDANPKEILKAYLYLIENYNPFWCTVFEELSGEVRQITIEILYKDLQ